MAASKALVSGDGSHCMLHSVRVGQAHAPSPIPIASGLRLPPTWQDIFTHPRECLRRTAADSGADGRSLSVSGALPLEPRHFSRLASSMISEREDGGRSQCHLARGRADVSSIVLQRTNGSSVLRRHYERAGNMRGDDTLRCHYERGRVDARVERHLYAWVGNPPYGRRG